MCVGGGVSNSHLVILVKCHVYLFVSVAITKCYKLCGFHSGNCCVLMLTARSLEVDLVMSEGCAWPGFLFLEFLPVHRSLSLSLPFLSGPQLILA